MKPHKTKPMPFVLTPQGEQLKRAARLLRDQQLPAAEVPLLEALQDSYGGRMIDAILTNTMLPDISREILNRMLEGKPIQRVQVGVRDGAFDYAFS